MKISARYLSRLENYLDWARCSTPLKMLWTAKKKTSLRIRYSESGRSAAECMQDFESCGVTVQTCTEPDLLQQYADGKSNRDYWFKEMGCWKKECIFIDEEFLPHLTPCTFAELFGRWPRTHMIRYLFDNNYSIEDFNSDTDRLYKYGLEHERCGWRYVSRALGIEGDR